MADEPRRDIRAATDDPADLWENITPVDPAELGRERWLESLPPIPSLLGDKVIEFPEGHPLLRQPSDAAGHRDGPPYTHTLTLPETEEEMAAEPPPPFTLEDGSPVTLRQES